MENRDEATQGLGTSAQGDGDTGGGEQKPADQAPVPEGDETDKA